MHRSLTRPFFAKDRVRDFEILDKYAMKAIDKMKRRFDEGHALNFWVSHVRGCSWKVLTKQTRTQDVIRRFTLDAACEFLFETNLHALDSELLYPHTGSHFCDQAPARELSREEAFSRALVDAETVLIDRLHQGDMWPLLEFFKDKAEPHMEVMNRFLNPVLEEGLAKHAARTKAGLTDREGETLLDSLLRETTGLFTSKSHGEPSN